MCIVPSVRCNGYSSFPFFVDIKTARSKEPFLMVSYIRVAFVDIKTAGSKEPFLMVSYIRVADIPVLILYITLRFFFVE